MRTVFVAATVLAIGVAFAACGGSVAPTDDAGVSPSATTTPTTTTPTTTTTTTPTATTKPPPPMCPTERPAKGTDCSGNIECFYPCVEGGLYRGLTRCVDGTWRVTVSECEADAGGTDAASDGDTGELTCPEGPYSNGVRCYPDRPCLDSKFSVCLTGCCIARPP